MGVLFRIRLADVDRDRYGCPEWLEVDLDAVTGWEYALMQRGFVKDGLRVAFDSPTLWSRALTGEVVTDENGAPVMDPVTGLDGEPTVVPRRRPNFGAELILIWLALRHNGIDVPMADVVYRAAGVRWDMRVGGEPEDEPVPGESEGKDDDALPSESEKAPISAT